MIGGRIFSRAGGVGSTEPRSSGQLVMSPVVESRRPFRSGWLTVDQGLLPRSEDLHPSEGNEDGMFELCRQASVDRDRSPIVFEYSSVWLSDIDHRFDRKRHTRLEPSTSTPLTDVADLRFLVKFSTNSVSDERRHYGTALSLGVLLNCCADVAEPSAGPHLRNPQIEALSRDFRHVSSFGGHLPNVEGCRGIAVKTLKNVGHVDIDDVALAKSSL